MSVFANGLEISGKAVQAQTIAAFPDVCFTPPQTPATPPGVPIPYPSFGMAADTEKGTSTVKIKGKTVNIKNKSDLKRTSGTEAGCAPKKGVITSKNMGKEYFNSWSNDVKMDGEPVIRMSDLATNNHASPSGNTPPWVHVCAINFSPVDCVTILQNLGVVVHQHKNKACADDEESEHFVRNQFFQRKRGTSTYKKFGSYDVDTAPCICMQSRHKQNGTIKRGKGSKKYTAHWAKTKRVRDWLKKNKSPPLGEAMDVSIKSVGKHHRKIKKADKKTKEHALECLKLIHIEYLKSVVPPKKNADGTQRPPTNGEITSMAIKA